MAALLDIARNNAALIAVLAPFIGAALAALSPAGRWACAIAMIATTISAAAACDLAARALTLAAPPPAAESGLALRLDGVGAFIGGLVAALGALIAWASPAFVTRTRQAPYAIAFFLLALTGWIASAYAGDLVTLHLALTLASVATVAAAALGAERDRAALSAALRLLIAAGVAGAVLTIGVALIARSGGGASFASLAHAQLAAPGAGGVGYGLAFGALAMMAGVAPLNLWTAAFYGRGAALAVAAFGALGVAALLGALTRIAAYAVVAPALGEGVSRALLALGLASVAIGSVQAVGARDLRRLAAYAAAAQAGCVLIAVAMGSPAGFAAALVQIFALAIAALALTIAAPAHGALEALDGLGRRAPFASLALTAGALSLMGAPLTLGFLGRWRLIEAGVGGGWWWAAGAVIFASLSAVFYGGRLIERIYFRRASIAHERAHEPWRVFLAPALVVAFAGVLMGADPSMLLRAADNASRFLTGAAP